MANFYVVCKTCETKLAKKLKRERREPTVDEYESLVLFETAHAITATDDEIANALVCPRCSGTDCHKTFYGYNTIGYIRGDGYLDRAGCQRDMHLHHLETDDPYAGMRVTGEVEDLKVRLKRAGRHNPKTQHFAQVKSSDVQEAVSTKAVAPDRPIID